MVKGRQGERVRLYVRGTILGYKRSKSNQYPNTSLIQIEGVNTKEEVAWYAGKRMAYIYKAKLGHMVTVVLFVPNSSLTFPPNLWEIEFESSCTPATFEFSLDAGQRLIDDPSDSCLFTRFSQTWSKCRCVYSAFV
ncbi:hypothetical protein V6N11_057279 [Hibiscus sabdariffa]|uniref:Ribosomal protein L35A n=1 Tax=Hibiscus sabdariffa TaxID=183260 RepID=A0ABR2NKZ1_9ROSI